MHPQRVYEIFSNAAVCYLSRRLKLKWYSWPELWVTVNSKKEHLMLKMNFI